MQQTIITRYDDIEKPVEVASLVHHKDNQLVAEQGNSPAGYIIVQLPVATVQPAHLLLLHRTPGTRYTCFIYPKPHSIVRLERLLNRADITKQANHEG